MTETVEGSPVVRSEGVPTGETVEGSPVVQSVDVTPAATPAGNNPTASTSPTATTEANSSSAPAQSSESAPEYHATAPAGGDALTLLIGNVSWSGWQRVRLQRSIDAVPANFQVQVTERYPTQPDINIMPGAKCKVYIGGDLVLTGWIDRYHAVITPDTHTVEIMGRSLSADLVDCAAFTGPTDPNSEKYLLSPGSVYSVIKQVADPYKITVQSQVGDGAQVVQAPYAISFGETPWEIIDRVSKAGEVIVYDMPDGSLMVAQAGKEQMSSGFVQGVNVEQAEVNYTMDQRFSVYEGFQTSTPILSLSSGGTSPPQAIFRDPVVEQSRFRKRIVISEQAGPQPDLVKKRTEWEMKRRAGRSVAITVTCDSWRDSSGNLWAPNHLAIVSVPVLKTSSAAQTWCIGQVVYIKDEEGRHAIVTLMPPEAFQPEPMPFIPMAQTGSDVGATGTNPTSQTPADAPAPTVEGSPVVQPTGQTVEGSPVVQ